MAVWLIFLAIFTWLFNRDGGFHQFSIEIELGILALFWLFGIAGASHVYNIELTKVVFENRSADSNTEISAAVIAIKPWSRTVENLPADSFRDLEIQRLKDSDGDEYFSLVFTTPGGRKYTLREGHDHGTVHATLTQINEVLRLMPRGSSSGSGP